jgi:hypothetical protein
LKPTAQGRGNGCGLFGIISVVLSGLMAISCLTDTLIEQGDPRAVYYHAWGPAITIAANEFQFLVPDLAYKLTNLTWTAVSLPGKTLMNEDLSAYKTSYPNGFEISGTTAQISGIHPGNGQKHTEYVFINKDDPSKLLWFSSGKLFMIWERN